MQKVTDPALLAQLNGSPPVAQPTVQPSSPGIIMGRPKSGPTPYQQGRDSEADARANEDQQIQREKFNVETGNVGFTQRDKLRSDYMALPAVKGYSTSIEALASALKRGDDGSGDTALIYDYVKSLDPTSVVREAEVGMAQGGDSYFNNLVAKAKKQFGMDEGGNLSPEARRRLRREIINSNVSRVKQYNQAREQFAELARRNGIDPYEIVGNHAADPYVDLFRSYDQENKIGDYTPGRDKEALSPEMTGPNDPQPDLGEPGTLGVGELGGEREIADDSSLGPGDKWVFDDAGNRIGILAADGSFSAYGSIVDDASMRDAEAKIRQEMQAKGISKIDSSGGLYKGATANWSDEIKGLGGGLRTLLTEGDFGKGYRSERDAERAMQKMSRDEYGVLPELAGGLTTAFIPLGQAKTAGQFVAQGAGLGAFAGAGEGRGSSDTALNALIGSGVGGALGYGIQKGGQAVNALLGTQAGQRAVGAVDNAITRARPNVDAEVVAAGTRQNIPVRLADAVEGKRPAMAALEKTRTGAPRVAAAKAEDIAATQARLAGLVPNGAEPKDETQLGKMLQSAMTRQNEAAKGQTTAFYNRVEKMAPGARSDGKQTLSFIDDQIANLEANGRVGNASFINALKGIRYDIAESGVTVGSLQSLRRTLRQRIKDNNLDPSSTDTLFAGVDQAATAELRQALGSANPKAVAAFDRANKSHAERLAFRNEVARELLGTRNNPLDAEKAATRLMSKIASKGDEEGFGRIWSSLDDTERGDTAATILHNLGGGEEFSLQKLATGLENANDRTLRTVFGKDGYEALRDIRLIARRKTQTQKGLNNSNTGSVVEEKGNSLLDTILGVFGYTQGGPLGAAAAVGTRSLGEKIGNSWRARLLLRPDFTKWLRRAPDTTNPDVINRYFDRLNKAASREQSFLMDARQLQQYLADQFSKSPGRAAADDNSGERRGVEPK